MLESLFNKVTVLRACNFNKEDFNTGVFLWILWNIQDTYFADYPRTAGSDSTESDFSLIKLQAWGPEGL